VGKGLDAYVAIDASGTFSETKRQVGLPGMLQAGVIVSDHTTLKVTNLRAVPTTSCSALQQTTDHRINGLDVPHSEERTIGIGPGLQFGGRETWFRLNSYIETDVRNRPTGIKVTFRISKAVPTLRLQQ
jgi:hypothetical protein